jgi:hypothetical protein
MHLSTHAKRVDTALCQIWGPELPAFNSSPMFGTPLDTAEIVLHELAHQTLMPLGMTFSPGMMSKNQPQRSLDAFETVNDWLGHLPAYRRDLHEIRAIAIELLAGKKLHLPLDEKRITDSGWRNSHIKFRALIREPVHPGTDVEGFRARVKKAVKTSRTILAAETICALVQTYLPKGRR